MKFIPNNENFRIGLNGKIELCSGIKDFYGDLIYEGDWLTSVNGSELNFRVVYDDSTKTLVGIKTDKTKFKIQERSIIDWIKNNFYVDSFETLFFRNNEN